MYEIIEHLFIVIVFSVIGTAIGRVISLWCLRHRFPEETAITQILCGWTAVLFIGVLSIISSDVIWKEQAGPLTVAGFAVSFFIGSFV